MADGIEDTFRIPPARTFVVTRGSGGDVAVEAHRILFGPGGELVFQLFTAAKEPGEVRLFTPMAFASGQWHTCREADEFQTTGRH